jgi:dCMP deaminase
MMAAKLIATMATCPKLQVGSVVVKDRRIVSSGFNGAPTGHPHCTEVGCLLIEGEGNSCRRVIHSEHNAVLQDSRAVEGGVLYTPYLPCMDCMKAAIGAKISEVVYEKIHKDKPKYQMSKELAAQSSIKLRQIPPVDIVSVLQKYYGA